MGTDDSESGTDGVSIEAGLTGEQLYVIVRNAVEDAILGVIGTLLLVGIGFVLVVVGGQVLVAGGGNPASIALGLAGMAVGVYLAASALRVIPPIREW